MSGANVDLEFDSVVENAAYECQDPWTAGEVMWLEAKFGDFPWPGWAG